MRNFSIPILLIFLFAVLFLVFVSFQVRETESALVTRFGKAKRAITEPGLYFRWPSPIEKYYIFDSRMKVLEADIGETPTKGAVPIIVKTYIVWKISDPEIFFNAVGSEIEAESKLLTQISNAQNKTIGRHYFSEFVNSDPAKIKFTQIEDEMLSELQNSVAGVYGIEVKALGIKQLKVSKDVSKNVFERMSAERNRQTVATITEGTAQAKRITSDANKKKKILLAAAEARAMAIRAQGDAEAAKYYALLEEDPPFAMFLQDLDALKTILENRTTIVLSADTAPFDLLRAMPDIEPKK